jgi:two-component system sensor histidine kinase DesK
MFNWYRINRIGAAGVFASLLFGGMEVLVFWLDGVGRADLNTPVGVVANLIAAQFTPPPSPIRVGSDRRELTYALVVGTQLVVVALFSMLLWLRTRMRRPSRTATALQALQAVIGVATLSSLLYVLAAQLAVTLPTRKGLAWLAAQMTALAAAVLWLSLFSHLRFRDDSLHMIWFYCAIGLVFQVLVFGVSWIARRDHQSRLALATTNAHLLATQSMLADSVRAGERLRIARDLHDAVGHHLTALNLHLDLAMRQSVQPAPASLRTSRELAGSLLSEVRVVVGAERKDGIDLRTALATLCRGIPEPAVSLQIAQELDIASPALAHTVFFCVQEALTNTVRHAAAGEMAVALAVHRHTLILTMDDNGCGLHGAAEGHGLRGMRERLAEHDGTLAVAAGPRGGLQLTITLPLSGSGA